MCFGLTGKPLRPRSQRCGELSRIAPESQRLVRRIGVVAKIQANARTALRDMLFHESPDRDRNSAANIENAMAATAFEQSGQEDPIGRIVLDDEDGRLQGFDVHGHSGRVGHRRGV